MVDRLKYFLLGLLFLVVAGVIAYDRWNSVDEAAELAGTDEDRAEVATNPPLAVARDPEREAKSPEKPALERDLPIDTRPAPQPLPPVEPRPEPAPAAVKPKPASRVIHTVRPGETLEEIALQYYNTRKGIVWIAEANKLRDRNRIFVNQKLVIPAKKESVVPRKPAPARKAPKIPGTYVVKRGDGDLYAICRRLYGPSGEGERVARIMQLNGLYSAEVSPGTKLNLPPK